MSDLDLDALESRVNQRNGMSGVIVAKPLLRELLQAAREARRLREALELLSGPLDDRLDDAINSGYDEGHNGSERVDRILGAVRTLVGSFLEPVVSTEEKPDVTALVTPKILRLAKSIVENRNDPEMLCEIMNSNTTYWFGEDIKPDVALADEIVRLAGHS